MNKKSIILFDGVCNFCDRSVQFIIKRDVEGYFKFASLQGEIGKKLMRNFGLAGNMNSFVLIENNKCYIKSSAALRVCAQLRGVWKVLAVFLFVPAPIRDFFYDIIARNRYKWFGEKEQCQLPSPEIRDRFLDNKQLE